MSEKQNPDQEPVVESPDPSAPAEPAAPALGRPAWLRGNAGVIGGGLALALVAGFSGFALAQVIDDRDGHRSEHGSFHGKRHGGHRGEGWMQRPGFDRQLPDESSDIESDGTTG